MKIAVDKLKNLNMVEINTRDEKVVSILLGNEETRDQLVRELIEDNTIYRHQIPLTIIKEYVDQLDWIMLVKTQKHLTEDLIREFAKTYIDSGEVRIMDINMAIFQNLSKEFIWEYRNNFDWNSMSMNPYVPLLILDENFDKLNWSYISTREDLTTEFIKKHKNQVNWAYISMTQDVIPGMEDNWSNGLGDFASIGKDSVAKQIKDKKTLTDEERAFVKQWERQVVFGQLLRKQGFEDELEIKIVTDE